MNEQWKITEKKRENYMKKNMEKLLEKNGENMGLNLSNEKQKTFDEKGDK